MIKLSLNALDVGSLSQDFILYNVGICTGKVLATEMCMVCVANISRKKLMTGNITYLYLLGLKNTPADQIAISSLILNLSN